MSVNNAKTPKVIRIHSDILNMDLRMNTKTFNVMTDDKVLYNHKEWVLLSHNGLEVDRTIHNIKKIFGGDVCEVMEGLQSEKLQNPTVESLDRTQSEDCQKLQQIGIPSESGQDLLF